MKYRLNEEQMEIITKAGMKYAVEYGEIKVEDLIDTIQDMLVEIDWLKETIEDEKWIAEHNQEFGEYED